MTNLQRDSKNGVRGSVPTKVSSTVGIPNGFPTDVLQGLVADDSLTVVPLVGSVTSNRRWLNEHLPVPSLDSLGAALPSDDWENIFDAGDEAVQVELQAELDAATASGELDMGDIGMPEPAPATPAAAKPKLELRLKGEGDN